MQLVADGEHGCAAVEALAGQRFLSHEVPTLPLADCDSDGCRCTYQLYEDRRTDVRRIDDETFNFAQRREFNRRGGTPGRRKDD